MMRLMSDAADPVRESGLVRDGLREAFLLGDVLRDVSRSFYLTLRILPSAIRTPIGLAYLLARTADSIADTAILPGDERLARLLQFRKLLAEPSEAAGAILAAAIPDPRGPDAARTSVSEAERRLLQLLPESLKLLRSLPETDRALVVEVVTELTVGMELDLLRFPDDTTLRALETFEELEKYTYHVAGCVGPFWTKMCQTHFPAFEKWDVQPMCELGVRFGKALQWTNILRDIPRDLGNGRCYLPADELNRVGLVPTDLLHPNTHAKLQPLYLQCLDHALDHYRAAWEYTMAIPKSCPRIRLACIWPVWIGLETLSLLRAANNPLDPAQRIRIPRQRVYRITLASMLRLASERALHAGYRQRGGRD